MASASPFPAPSKVRKYSKSVTDASWVNFQRRARECLRIDRSPGSSWERLLIRARECFKINPQESSWAHFFIGGPGDVWKSVPSSFLGAFCCAEPGSIRKSGSRKFLGALSLQGRVMFGNEFPGTPWEHFPSGPRSFLG